MNEVQGSNRKQNISILKYIDETPSIFVSSDMKNSLSKLQTTINDEIIERHSEIKAESKVKKIKKTSNTRKKLASYKKENTVETKFKENQKQNKRRGRQRKQSLLDDSSVTQIAL